MGSDKDPADVFAMPQTVGVVVVTYNRKQLLESCLCALDAQTLVPETIIVVDNASTDGTDAFLASRETAGGCPVIVHRLDHNQGGAGGFAEGLRMAIDKGVHWIWMMDDDAEPHADALAELMRVASNSDNIYGSLATHGEETSWLMTLLGDHPVTTSRVADIPAMAQVQMLPFLGFMIHRDLVQKIGLPDTGFFIAADDVEYCVRAHMAGTRIFLAGESHIEHPKSRPYKVKLPGYTLTARELPPWKRYYDTRNRLLIARRHYGARLFTQTLPGSFVRMAATLLKEPRKGAQLWAWCCGMFDGLLGIKGKRHEKWGIHQ